MEHGRRFEEGLQEVAQEAVHELVVDLSGLTFIDSTAAYLLLQLQHRFEGRVSFEGGTRQTQGLLQTAGLRGSMGQSNTDVARHPPPIGLPHPMLPPHRRSN
jgi:anti-anti-sigma regulatory factor